MAPTIEVSSKVLAELRTQRGTVKGQQTRLSNVVDRVVVTASEAELETRLGLLEGYFSNFNAVQTKIECLDETETDSEEREVFEETYCAVKPKFSRICPAGGCENLLRPTQPLVTPVHQLGSLS